MSRPARSGYIAFVMALMTTILVGACANPTATTSPSSASASHDPAPAGHPLIGTWTTTITPDDLRAGGITDEGGLAENSGTFTWTFEADGTWRQVQTGLDGAALLNPVFSGWYTLDDDLLVMVTEFPEQYKDDGLRYEYVVTGDSVTFELLNPPDPMLPVVVEAHPWARTQP